MTTTLTLGSKVHFNPSNRVGEIVKIHGKHAWVFVEHPLLEPYVGRVLYADLKEATR